jgi:hypothetical protein
MIEIHWSWGGTHVTRSYIQDSSDNYYWARTRHTIEILDRIYQTGHPIGYIVFSELIFLVNPRTDEIEKIIML